MSMAEEQARKEAEIASKSENESDKEERREEKEENRDTKTMKPWEQHAGVISIPRFDYNAPFALLHRSHSGFLITCSIKREKSATKEAISILQKYVGSYNNGRSESLENSSANNSTKRRKIYPDEIAGSCGERVKSEDIPVNAGGLSNDDCPSLGKTGTTVERDFDLSLVKLTKSGLVLLTFLRENSPDTVDILSNIFHHLESGSLKPPLWCHRIFPIQATCHLNGKELQTVVSKLVSQFINDKQDKLAWPIKFSVGYNRRGAEAMLMKIETDNSKGADPYSLLDRGKCFDVVASAVKDAVSDSAVDLKSPDLSVLVELLPLSGVPSRSLVAGISVLPGDLISSKPRLCIKPLVSDAKGRNGRSLK